MCDFSCYGGASEAWLAVQDSLPPPPPPDMPLTEVVRLNNEKREIMAAEAMVSLRPKVHIRDYSIPTRDGSSVKGRSYRPASADAATRLPVYIHLHGGGYLFGSLSSEDAICSRIALSAQVVVLNVNYRHTPEHTYPTAWHDVQDAFEWAHAHIDDLGGDGQKLLIGGISAGSTLAASLTLEQHLGRVAANLPRVAGQVLMVPSLSNIGWYEPQVGQLKDPSVSSYKENENAPILPVKMIHFFTSLLKIENVEAEGTKLNPGNATPEQVVGLPPTVFGIAGLDPLRDEGLLYAKMLAEAG